MDFEEPQVLFDRRIFWRITFDVFDHEVRLQQIATCWNLVERQATDQLGNPINVTFVERGFRKVINLQYQIIGDVKINNDRAVFNGGYIECQSADLTEFAASCQLPGLEEVGVPIDGENVSIRVDLKLNESHLGNPYPIFYYPQPDHNAVTLVENVDSTNDLNLIQVDWTVSGSPFSSNHFRLESLKEWHRVRVHQDLSGAANVFEFWADSAWLGNQPITDPTHLFDPGPRTFYIGWVPRSDEGLHGEISHLEFDPNNSCTNCMAFEPNE